MWQSQPPCEAVSWNVIPTPVKTWNKSQPPCEAVSWNIDTTENFSVGLVSASLWGCELKFSGECGLQHGRDSQPPCEAVSWNEHYNHVSLFEIVVSLLVRLWVEILRSKLTTITGLVSLLVRLWVEILTSFFCFSLLLSASLWGCELKFTSWFLLWIWYTVSLLVRLWVEIIG